jgi:hydroxymethylglutaryl-CoA lyase
MPDLSIKLHLHDTRGAAIANAIAALQLGGAEFDSSVGGLGGCPSPTPRVRPATSQRRT